MIKVNLLRDPTARAHKTFVKPTASRTGLALISFILLVAIGMGAWYLYVNTQKKNLTEERNTLRVEEAKLQELKKEIEQFKLDKQEREHKIKVIETLKENQTGPVLLLNHVLHSIPRNRLLWLTSLVQSNNRVQVVGYAQQIEAIPDFMTNLKRTGFFQSVDLETIVRETDASRFSLLCMSAQYQPEE
ncbi:MAG: PilN domain-containing protein [Acidobacteriota bacterium]